MKRTLIIITWQHLWSMKSGAGAPSYHHTVRHYIDSPNWDVHILTRDTTNLQLRPDADVHVHTNAPLIDKVMSIPKVNRIIRRSTHYRFSEWAENEAERIISNSAYPCVLYAYEVWGVLPAKHVADKYQLPLVTRFQGTILGGMKLDAIHRFIHYPHFEALETPSDLIIMTNDGSNGTGVLKQLGNNSHTLFLFNGLDLLEGGVTDLRQPSQSHHNQQDARPIKLLMASRLVGWKHVERGINGLAYVIGLGLECTLTIAGDGPERRNLEELTRRLNIQDKVTFLGAIEQKRLFTEMEQADIFLSLYDLANIGNPTFEAMLHGLPLIAFNVGGTKDVVIDGVTGILIDKVDAQTVGTAIMRLASSPEMRYAYGANGRAFIIDNFSSWSDRLQKEEREIINVCQSFKAITD